MIKKRFVSLLKVLFVLSIVYTVYTPAGTFAAEDTQDKQVDSVKGYNTEDRKWVTNREDLSVERYDVIVDENIEITMRDGTILRGRSILPIGIDRPLPTIVQLNGYGHETGDPFDEGPLDLAERGYAVLHMSSRGVEPSEGKSGFYYNFGEDGYDVIEWAADQQWSNGNVGMIGSSMLGIAQWHTARELPPSLKAISPVVACTNCYEDLWYPGGMNAGPGRVARGDEYDLASEHRDFDDWWKERSVNDEQLKAIVDHGVAAFIFAGWNDYISAGNGYIYEKFSKAGGDSKLVMSPGSHSGLPDPLPYEFFDYRALWFDHYLNDEDNGITERDPVLIYVQEANQWRYEDAWPLSDTNYVDLYLSDKISKSIDSINDGAFTTKPPTKKESSVSYEYSLEEGPFLPTPLGTSGRLQINQTPYEEKLVTWTTGKLAVPTEITGNISFTFWAEANSEDTDFVVEINDIGQDGTSSQVTVGYLNASRAVSRSNPAPVKPGEIVQYTINTDPTSYVFKEGHRIRLTVAGGVEQAEDHPDSQGPGHNDISSTIKIYQDEDHPSHLNLPLIGMETLSVEEPAEKDTEAPVITFNMIAIGLILLVLGGISFIFIRRKRLQ